MSRETDEQSETTDASKTAVLIVGMHRSGTSAMARVASLCGATLPARLMPPNLDNEAGFWEPVRIADLNDDLLHRIGLSWDDVRETDLSALAAGELEEIEARLAECLREDFADAQQIVLKEPRISRLLPLYQRTLTALGYRVVAVVMFRNPLAVIASLKARNGFDDAYAAQLWQRYVVESEAGTRAFPRIFVDFDSLLRDWRPVATSVSNALQLGWETSIEANAGAIGEFLKLDSRHHVFADDEIGARSDLDPQLMRSAEALRLFEADSQSPAAKSLMSAAADRACEISRAYAPIFMPELVRRSADASTHARSSQDAAAQTASLRTELASLHQSYEALAAELGHIRAKAEQDRDCAQNLQDALGRERDKARAEAERERLIAVNLQDAFDRSQEDVRAAAALNQDLQARWQPEIDAAVRASLESTEARHLTELGLARGEAAALRADAERIEAERASLRERHDSVVGSTSWRMTRPVRAAMRLVKGDWRAVRRPVATELQKIAVTSLRLARVPTGAHRAVTTRIYGRFGDFFRDTAHFELWQQRREAARIAAEAERIASLRTSELVERARSVRLASSTKPVVSVLIPAFAQVEMTLACIESIASHLPSIPCEFIVVDDASGHPDLIALDHVDGIRFLRNPVNLGFLRSCNGAAKHALGDYILFLNNDTLVTPGWVDRLVDIFASRLDAGLAGSKLVYPDGRLQEAGGIVWNDASAWNYGQGDDPNLARYNYVREVDFISGAALMVRRDLFERLGGFDDSYAPAYYEDCDLAFRVRAEGFKTYYQPASVVVHLEGASHGRDVTSGIKAHQIVNQRTMFERWRPLLESGHYRNAEHVFKARERALGRKTILIVDHYVPQVDRDAGSKLMFQYIEVMLSAGWLVKFWPDNLNYDPIYTPRLQEMGVEVLYGSEYNSFERWIAENGAHIDCALLSRPHIAPPYVGPLRQHSGARIVYCGIDLHAARMRMENSVGPGTHTQALIDHFDETERWLWASADASIYPAEEEAAVVRELSPGAAASGVSPYYYDDFEHGAPDSLPSRREILYVGGFSHAPNVDAAAWLVADIMPHVWRSHPDVKLHLVGSNPTERVRGLACDRVNVTGWVSEDDLTAHYRQARVAVVPLRFGAGVKSKVTESLRFGLPLVTTPVGAQGLPGLADVAKVCESDTEIADEIVRLLDDDDGWREQSRQAVAYASTRFTRTAMTEQLLGVVTAESR